MADFDKWPPEQNYGPPPIGARWQKELTRIAGTAPNGRPMLRLEWGQTCTLTPHVSYLKYQYRWQSRHVGWIVDVRDLKENYLHSIKFKQREHPGYSHVKPGFAYSPARPIYEREEVGVPRWIIAQYIPPDRLGDWDGVAKHFREQYGVDALGPMPREGFYWFGFHTIADHRDGCCLAAEIRSERCFGLYRPPSDIDLKYCSALWQLNEAETFNYRWTDVPTREAIEKRTRQIEERWKEDRDKQFLERRAAIKDALSVSIKRLTGEGSGLDLVRYHDLGSALKNLKGDPAPAGA